MNGQTPPISTCSSCGATVKSDYYIDPTTKNWMIYGKDTGINAKGLRGDTPFIGTNNHWWIGNTDTGVPANGTVDMPSPQTDTEIFY